ncbi:DUF4123 domain-containing protein [Pantoea sp. S-LA4]
MDSASFNKIKEEIFKTVFANNGRCFMLIDASLEQYRSNSFLYDALKDYPLYPVIFDRDELHDALPLYLVSLDVQSTKDNELFHNSIHHAFYELGSERINSGEGRSVCAWISTPLTTEQLSESISRSAVQTVQTGGDVLIRYFDPSVFGLFLPILDNWQKEQLLRNINVWCYIDGDGTAQVVNGDGGNVKKLSYSLELTELNFLDINNIAIINNILRKYREKQDVGKVREQQAVRLLQPALRYFHDHFSSVGEGVNEFGLDVLNAQQLFYQDGVFEKYLLNNNIANLPLYPEVKARVERLEWEKAFTRA